MRRLLDKLLPLFLILSGLFISCSDDLNYSNVLPVTEYPNRTSDFTLWQLAQFNGDSQMGYIIRTDDAKLIVIDGGLQESVKFINDYLVQLGGEVDTWILTHPHKDHMGALEEVIKAGKIKINKIIHSKIDLGKIKKYETANYKSIQEFYALLDSSGILVVDANLKDTFPLGDGVLLKILGIRNENILVNLVNNSSLVFKVSSQNKSVLFLGDLGKEGGVEVLKNVEDNDIASDYVQMSHHGQGGVTKEFYEEVNATYALWPTPVWLWENNLDAKGENSGTWKTMEVREWMRDLKIKKNVVSGLEGNTQIH